MTLLKNDSDIKLLNNNGDDILPDLLCTEINVKIESDLTTTAVINTTNPNINTTIDNIELTCKIDYLPLEYMSKEELEQVIKYANIHLKGK